MLDGGGQSSKVHKAVKRSGLNEFGFNGMIYEMARNGMCGNMQQVKDLRLHDFASALSYIRCESKFSEYINE